MKNDDDILEHALNFGVNSSAKKYNIEKGYVRNVVLNFSMETCLEEKCTCERLWDKGVCMDGCTDCDKGKNKRIKI